MKEFSNYPENLVITPENTSEILKNIGYRREHPDQLGNSEEILIPQIDNYISQAKKLNDLTPTLTFYQEKLLCAKHMVMEGKSKKDPIRIGHGLLITSKTVTEMIDFQKENENEIDPIINARTDRFVGRYYDGIGQFKKAEKLYQKAKSFFESLTPVDQKFHRLELAGFLAFSQLKQNKPSWFELTKLTLSEFDNSPDGIWLKDTDYYTWAVWKSGIEIRNSDSLLDQKKPALKYKNEINLWLDDAKLILNNDNFKLRLDELKDTQSKAQKIFKSSK